MKDYHTVGHKPVENQPKGYPRAFIGVLVFLQLLNSAGICYVYSLTASGGESVVVRTVRSISPQPKAINNQEVDSYRTKLGVVQYGMGQMAILSIQVSSAHVNAWKQAIAGRDDINDAVQLSMKRFSDSMKTIETGKPSLEKMIATLNSPPAEFVNAHGKIVSAYGSLTAMMDGAVSPSGTFSEYKQRVEKNEQEYMRLMDEVRVLIPSKTELR